MATLNAGLRALIEVLQLPFSGLAPIWGVLAWSVVSAIGILLVFKRVSNQKALHQVKRKIHANLFEIRLFNDDLRAMFRAQLEILRHNLTYLRLNLYPMLFILPPMVLLIGQLHAYYGFRALIPGERGLLTAELNPRWREQIPQGATGARPEIELELPPGLRAESPGVWSEELNQMVWRLVAEQWGEHDVRLLLAGEEATKRVQVALAITSHSPVRPDGELLEQLLWPAEPPLPSSGVFRAITIGYPDGDVGLLGWNYTSEYAWMVAYFVLSVVFAFALRKPLGVTI